ncbi:MAG: GAF domain-containing protein [Anaerolineae bacterium]|nr:GAF domain-containing protein [Anaerolineae bacterium]
MSQRGLSLRWRMFLLNIGIPLLVLGTGFLYIGWQYRNAYREAYFGKGDLITRELTRIIETIAPYVKTIEDAPGLQGLLQDMARDVPEFDFIALVDDTGLVVEASTPDLISTRLPALKDLAGSAGVARRVVLGRPVYLVTREMLMPGDQTRSFYIVVAEKTDLVEPPMTAPILVGVVGIGVATLLLQFALAQWILKPLSELEEGTAIIGTGELSHTINMNRNDEFGSVAQAFNKMARRLQEQVVGLEQRVEVRTAALERKTVQLEAVSLVSKEASQVRNVGLLLDTTVNAVSDKFNFYHTGIFILDDEKEWAILRSASSEGGKRMLARGHRLAVGQVGIVGYVAKTGAPRIAFDVGEDAVWFNNPDLPDTRSEMALPLKAENEVIGVLDVQSVQSQAFTDEDISTLQLMADQLAIALYNTRLLEAMEGAIEELRQVQIEYTRQGWARMATRTRALAYEYDRVEVNPVPPLPVPVDLQEGRVDMKVLKDGASPVVMEAMRAGDRVVGYIGLSDPSRVWAEEELELISSVTEQVALALDNARLFEEAQRNERQQVLISRVLQVAANPEETQAEAILAEIARVLSNGLDMAIGIFTFPFTNMPLVHPEAVVDAFGDPMLLFPRDFTLPDEYHIFLRGLAHPELGPMEPLLEQVREQLPENLREDLEAVSSEYNFRRVLYVPIGAAAGQGGFISMIQRHDDLPLDPETRELAQNLANQIGVIINSLNLSEETRQRAEEFSQLYEAGIELLAIRDARLLLDAATVWGRRVLEAPASVAFLKDSETGVYVRRQSTDDLLNLPEVADESSQVDALTESIITNRENILIQDNRIYDASANADLIAAGLYSQIGVPLQVGEEVLGAMFIHDTEVNRFGEEDLRLLEFLATQVSAALLNAIQFDRTEMALSEQEFLYRASAELSTAESYEVILDVMRRYTILGKGSVNISMNYFDHPWVGETQPELVYVLTRWTHLPASSVSDVYPFAAFYSGQKPWFGFTPIFLQDIATDSRIDETLRMLYVKRFQAKSTIFVPLIAGAVRVGYLNAIYPETMSFTEIELRRLASLAGQAAVGIQNLHQLREIQARAQRESLIRTITEQIQRSPDVEGVLQTGLRELSRAFGTSRNMVYFRPPKTEEKQEPGDEEA